MKPIIFRVVACLYGNLDRRSHGRQAIEENLQKTQYNDSMYGIAVFMILMIGIVWSACALAFSEDNSSQQPSAQERLNQVLDSEGGTTVYKDHHGNVESVIELPNGERRVIVQPPQSPGFNSGPPLQLNNQTLTFPPPPPAPVHPPAPEFPQRAR